MREVQRLLDDYPSQRRAATLAMLSSLACEAQGVRDLTALSHVAARMRDLDEARRLDELQAEASGFRPYSEDEDAPMIDPGLAKELTTTREAIARHERNLQKFQADEQSIVARFDGDIDRFKALKGVN